MASTVRWTIGRRPTPHLPAKWGCNVCYSKVFPLRPADTVSNATATSPWTGSVGELPGEYKPYYITTPIFYVNASPHVGHMYTMILADVHKRWQKLLGKRALLSTGTDEHGIKVQRAAAVQNVHPRTICDTNSAWFKHLAEVARVDSDFFVRTTDRDHIEAVKHFWFLLQERGFIYESKHQGWYCVSDECYYPESAIGKRLDKITGEVHMASQETGNSVEWVEETNYHFRMTAFKEKLLAFYNENPTWLVPATRMREVVSWVENNLEDLSISRPAERLRWGIPVPCDESQTIYVWIDALVNYVAKAGFPNWTPGERHHGGWPADVHVIGKDIVRFHCVYWPALLMALDLPLPKRVLSHAHWTMGGRKMSKSTANVVNPFAAIDRFGADPMRFFLIHDGGIAYDSAYDNASIIGRYKKQLQWSLGNLVGRLTRSKKWQNAEIIASIRGQGQRPTDGIEKREASMAATLRQLGLIANEVAACMAELDASAALRKIMTIIENANRFMTEAEPWALVALTDDENQQFFRHSMYTSLETVRISGILLQPFMPDKAGQLLDILGVRPDRRSWENAFPFKDFAYGQKGRADKILFPPLPIEE